MAGAPCHHSIGILYDRHGMKRIARLLSVLLVAPGILAAADNPSRKPTSAQLEHFEKVIRPLLVRRCHSCHSSQAKPLKAGLRLDTRGRALSGGDTGPALLPGDPDKSLLVQAIRYDGDYKMPPSGKLPADEIQALVDWVRAGAAWPDGGDEPVDPTATFDLPARRKAHWAWQPVATVTPPALPKGTPAALSRWSRLPVDRFVLAGLLDKELAPAPVADRLTWLRRVTYDLTGMPPSPSEIDTFLGDRSDTAHQTVVDRLLAGTRYGEHWARHWLDLVRFAESRGHESDFVTPNAWEYRDYVIRAFNNDVSYDMFLVEHVAGDLLPRPRRHPERGYNESILATGFWHLGEWCHSPVDLRQDEADRHDNMIDVFSKTFLGLTVSCARCHDHKFDAISQKDYYSFAGFLKSSGFRLVRYETIEHNRDVARRLALSRHAARKGLYLALSDIVRPGIVDLPAYLLSARDVISNKLTTNGAALVAAADARKLGVERLERVVAHLVAARKMPSDPLHAWSLLCEVEGEVTDKLLSSTLEGIRRQWSDRQIAAAGSLKTSRLLVDFGRLTGRNWRANGPSFRLGPVEPGDFTLGRDATDPIGRVFTRASAAWDPAFSGLVVDKSSENENGRLGGWVRAGRSIRTPTFALKTGTLWYLVAGGGHAFASVNSHRLLHGPLHGQTVLSWKAEADPGARPRWIRHNLSAFAGRRIHIEFSTSGDKPLQLFLVAEGGQSPGNPFAADGVAALATELSAARTGTLELTARASARVFESALAWSIRPTVDRANSQAVVLEWVVDHLALLVANSESSRQRLAAVAGPAIANEKRLVGEIRKSSRLAIAMWDGSSVDQNLFIRGNPGKRDKVVPRRMLEALGGRLVKSSDPGSGRLSLAVALVEGRNPLVRRVVVNRIWHHLFGRGLVPTVDNLGVQGQEPSHPELLDWLADRFLQERWSIKKMIRRLVLSRTYRMSSRPAAESVAADPTNRWLHSMRVKRLSGEAIRDAMLSVAGRLDRGYLGKSVPVYLSRHMIGRGRPKSGPMDGNGRRTIYIGVRRNFLSSMMLAFDTPQPFSTVGRRTRSNVPAQALILMNDPFVVSQAKLWARRLLARKELGTNSRIELMYRESLGRRPSDDELSLASGFLVEQGRRYGLKDEQGSTDVRAWGDLCHVMFNAKEFLFIN